MQQRIQLATGSGEIVSGVICTMTQRHLLQIEALWENMLIEAEQADMDWNWDYKLRLATNNDRFEAYVIDAYSHDFGRHSHLTSAAVSAG